MAFPTLTCRLGFGSNALAGTPTWTDVSTDLLGFSTRRGRQYQLDRFEPGEARITLNNKHNNYWPNNGASPYSPNVKVGVQANLRATYGGSTYDLFTGLVERWIPGYRSHGGTQGAVMELTAVEATKVLQRADLTGQSYVQENSGTRVTNVLNTAGWPTNLRSINAGQSTIQASGTITNQKANDHLANVALAELGNFYQSPTMQAVWQDRHARLKSPYTTSQGTVGVAATEWPYTNPRFRFDDSQIYNDISIARASGGTKTATDATSQNSYGKRSMVRTGILSTSDAELQDQANYLNSRYKEPALTVDSMTIKPGVTLENQTIVSDTFNRSDSTTTLGNAETGQAWTAQLGTWGISGNQAYCASGAYGRHLATVPADIADSTIECQMQYTVTSSDVALVFRFQDTSNYWYVWIWNTDGSVRLSKRIAGVNADQASYAAGWATGVMHTIKVITSGSSIAVYLDGTLRISVTDAALATATACGFYQEGTSGDASRFDNFTVTGQGKLFRLILAREISDRVTVSLPSGSVSADYHIEGIEHNVVGLHWETHWQLSPASAQQFWTLGVAGLSELGSTTRLAY